MFIGEGPRRRITAGASIDGKPPQRSSAATAVSTTGKLDAASTSVPIDITNSATSATLIIFCFPWRRSAWAPLFILGATMRRAA